jgi:hypothetical protein
VAREWDGSLIQWGLAMRRLIWALVVCTTLAGTESARAASIVFDFAGFVSSDVYTSPLPGPPNSNYYPSTIPANAVGQPFSGVAGFSDVNAVAITSNTFTGLLQAGQTALATLMFQGTSGPFSLSSNDFPNSNPVEANLAFNSNGFTSSIYANFNEADRIQNNALFLSQTGSQFQGSLELGSAGSAGFGRTLNLDITSLTVSAVPLPPALPLFALALLALGIFGYMRRAKHVTPAHGQAH